MGAKFARAMKKRMWLTFNRREALRDQGGQCCYCAVPLSGKTATAEHVVPVIKGGLDTRENIKAACRECNMLKSHKSEAAFVRLIKNPQPGDDIRIWDAWSRRRIWMATQRAVRRISAAVT